MFRIFGISFCLLIRKNFLVFLLILRCVFSFLFPSHSSSFFLSAPQAEFITHFFSEIPVRFNFNPSSAFLAAWIPANAPNLVPPVCWRLERKMAAYYPSLTSPKNILHSQYFTGQKVASDLPENMIYHGQPSTVALHSQLLSGSSFSGHNCVEVHSVESRDEMSLISQNGDSASTQPISRPLNITPGLSEGSTAMVDPQIFQHNFLNVRDEALQFQELSLSLGTESSGQISSYQNHYAIPGPSSWMSSGVGNAEGQGSEIGGGKIGKYLSFDSVGAGRDPHISLNSTEVNPACYWQDRSGFVGYFYNSKYLKAAQDLLDEAVNVREALKPSGKLHNFRSHGEDASEEADAKSKLSSTGIVSGAHESAAKASSELSASERQALLNRMTKLSSMSEEVDKRYIQYHQQMKLLVSSFEVVAGNGSAKPYTRLALQTISHQFRHLRDTIKKQIQVTQQCLGEQGETANIREGLPRLRYIDQQLRQQRTLQQFGIVRQPWRPQKGLPETAVSILRAWLFEHFLNPYPKDSEKIMLAKQTGLTRNQVANWFINARVRLWKPMIEDMYKEEFGETEADSQRSSEQAPPAPTESESSTKLQSLHKSSAYAVSGDDSLGQSIKLRTDDIPDSDLNASTTSLNFKTCTQEVEKRERQLLKSQLGQELNLTDDSIRPDSCNITTLSCAAGNQVSLALGLQQNEKTYQGFSTSDQLNENNIVATSAELSRVDYYCLESLNQTDRFANSHLLSDFIA